jgi:hypothetical protein
MGFSSPSIPRITEYLLRELAGLHDLPVASVQAEPLFGLPVQQLLQFGPLYRAEVPEGVYLLVRPASGQGWFYLSNYVWKSTSSYRPPEPPYSIQVDVTSVLNKPRLRARVRVRRDSDEESITNL